MPPFQAALKGSKEIGFAIIAMTLTLAAVYVPLAFSTGRTGRLFIEFALTLAGAVLVSGFTALSLSPMMCGKLLRHQTTHNRLYEIGESALRWMDRSYRRLVTGALRLRWLVVGIAAVVFGIALVLFLRLPRELAPQEDQGFIIGFGMAPEGSTVQYTDSYARQMEGIFAKVPEVERYFVIVGFPAVTQTIGFVMLKDWEQRDRLTADVQGQLFPQFMGIPGIMAFPTLPPPLGGDGFGQPVSFVVQTHRHLGGAWRHDAEAHGQDGAESEPHQPGLRPQAGQAAAQDRAQPRQGGLGRHRRGDSRAHAGDPAGRPQRDSLQEGLRAVRRHRSGRGRRPPHPGRSVQHLRAQRQRPDGAAIQPCRRARDRRGQGAQPLQQAPVGDDQRRPGARLLDGRGADLDGGRAQGGRAPEAQYDLAGQSREFRESASDFALIFALAIVFIFLVLAAQFESWVDPLVILLAVPLAAFGAFLALKLTGGSWNIYSQIGIVTLVGLIAKHGILIVEFANQLQERGKSKLEAVIDAAALRLRPILMTTGAMVLGSVPLAIATGAGAEARNQIGWVIVGGMAIGTFFTLFVVPVVYLIIGRDRHQASAAQARIASSTAP